MILSDNLLKLCSDSSPTYQDYSLKVNYLARIQAGPIDSKRMDKILTFPDFSADEALTELYKRGMFPRSAMIYESHAGTVIDCGVS